MTKHPPFDSEDLDLDLIIRAEAFASSAHALTNHRYGEHPYEHHLSMVACVAYGFLSLLPVAQRSNAIAGAWVHDTIEDARCSYNDVRKATGAVVAEIAYALTNEKGRTRSDRANDRYYAGIRQAEVFVFVKLCDRLANVKFSAQDESGMLEKYRDEFPAFIAALRPGFEQFDPMWKTLAYYLNVLNVRMPHDEPSRVDEPAKVSAYDFSPGDVCIEHGMALRDTFGKCERECAAAVVVLTMQHFGLNWDQPVTLEQIAQARQRMPWVRLFDDPELGIHLAKLAKNGFAVMQDNAFVFTAEGVERLRKHLLPKNGAQS